MNCLVVTEQRFHATPDGAVWTESPFARRFWDRYLDVFGGVVVLARVRRVGEVPAGWARADGEGVAFADVPSYVGPVAYLRRARAVRSAAVAALRRADAVILRVGSQLAAVLEPSLRRSRKPYGVEVIGDPYDVFAPGAVVHPLRPFFRWWFPRQLRRQCAGACAASYVTERMLQRRYPPHPSAFATHYSSIDLPAVALAPGPRPAGAGGGPARLISVGTLEQLYKAPDVLIDAVAACASRGVDLEVGLVGDGRFRPALQERARGLGIGDRVRFLGHLPPGEAVRAALDSADLFVLPSKQEGLPRAMIEAMARGLPCIGSTVGGIPELLPPEDLVPPGDAGALAAKIAGVLADPARMAAMSARNLDRARGYRDDVLRARRVAFYRHVREETEAWAAGRCAS
jgi:glycosyltransferase involved in cell wall biosynthesis